ncbi:MAG: hypothetical protein OXI95_09325 [bacterium]|nr:hypothetical protein [bacterium]
MQARLFRFVTALHSSGLDPRCIERVGERVPAMLFGLDAQGANATGGAVPASIRDDALKMLADLTVAATDQRRAGPGLPRRQEAAQVRRSLQRPCRPRAPRGTILP